nr:HD-GYP domain-containing protein [Tissierella sp.]
MIDLQLNNKTKTYIAFIYSIAILIFVYLFIEFEVLNIKMLLFWSVLSIIAESLLIALSNNSMAVSVGSAINLSAIIVGGPLFGVIIASLGMIFRFPKIPEIGYRHIFNTPIHITLFNVSQVIIVTGIMGILYTFPGRFVGKFFIVQTIFVLLIGTLLNTMIISILMSFLSEDKFLKAWVLNMKGTTLSVIAVGSIGIIMALSFISYGYGAVILFFGPLLLARYSFKLYNEMRAVSLTTIQSLSKALDAKDSYTSGHASRVEEYSVKLAKEYGLSLGEIENIKTAAILHDIGKIGIVDDILNKNGKLTDEEFQKIKEHPSVGADIIGEISFLKDVSKIIRHHHERYDGKGYPQGLKGDEIPIESSILSIADSYDAMTSNRPYRGALTRMEALREINKNAGTQFHPILAKKFIYIIYIMES